MGADEIRANVKVITPEQIQAIKVGSDTNKLPPYTIYRTITPSPEWFIRVPDNFVPGNRKSVSLPNFLAWARGDESLRVPSQYRKPKIDDQPTAKFIDNKITEGYSKAKTGRKPKA